MTYSVFVTPAAREVIRRLYAFLAQKHEPSAKRSRDLISKAFDALAHFPYSYRKATDDDPSLREVMIPFGDGGYVALFRIREDLKQVRILAIRHQLDDDYL